MLCSGKLCRLDPSLFWTASFLQLLSLRLPLPCPSPSARSRVAQSVIRVEQESQRKSLGPIIPPSTFSTSIEPKEHEQSTRTEEHNKSRRLLARRMDGGLYLG